MSSSNQSLLVDLPSAILSPWDPWEILKQWRPTSSWSKLRKSYFEVGEDQIKECLSKLDVCKFVDLHKIQQAQKKLASVSVGPFLIVYERSWRLGLIPQNWKKGNYKSPGQMKRRIQGTAGHSTSPQLWESDNTNNPENHFQTYEGQEANWEQSEWIHQRGIIFDQLDSLLWWGSCLGGWGKSSGCCLFRLQGSFDTVFHTILIDKLMKYWLDKWTVRCIKKLAELPGSKGCNQQHKVRLQPNHWWCPSGADTRHSTFSYFY